MDAELSAFGNVGFERDWTASAAATDPAANPGLAAVLRAADGGAVSGYFGLQSVSIPNGQTATFGCSERTMSSLSIVASRGVQSWADVLVNGAGVTLKAKGTDFEVANSANPGTGNFNCWRSGPGEISIQNDSGSTRTVTVAVLAPN